MQSIGEKLGILDRFSLRNQVAIVTGSGNGIGRSIAVSFALIGAKVICAEINPAAGSAVAEEIRTLGGEAVALTADVLDSNQIDEMIRRTLTEFEKIDILVNNVGGTGRSRRTPIIDMKEETWDLVIKLNLKSNFLCTRAVTRVMMEQKRGNIVNIASNSGLRPYPSLLPYGASKAAIINFTMSMAIQLMPYNIRVNAIAPGTVATASATYLGNRDERSRKRGTPLGKAGRVEDAALAAIYLASDASKYVTGVTIEPTGGPPFGAFLLEDAEREWKKNTGNQNRKGY